MAASKFKMPNLEVEADDPEILEAVKLPPTSASYIKQQETKIVHYVRNIQTTIANCQKNLEVVQKLNRNAQIRRAGTTQVGSTLELSNAQNMASVLHPRKEGSPLLQATNTGLKLEGESSTTAALPPSAVSEPPQSGTEKQKETPKQYGKPSVTVKNVLIKKKQGDGAPPSSEAGNGEAASEKEKKTLIEMKIPYDKELVPEMLKLKTLTQGLAEALEAITMWLTLRMAAFRQGSQTRSILEMMTERIGELIERASDREDHANDHLRAKADMEKALFKHPLSKVLIERMIVLIPEHYDVVEDSYRMMISDLINLQLYMTKDLPVVEEVVQVEGYGGGNMDAMLEQTAMNMFS